MCFAETFASHSLFQGDEEDAADDDGAASKPRRPQAAAAAAAASASSSHTDSDSDAFADSDSDSDSDSDNDSGGNHGTSSRAKRASIKQQLAALEAKANRSSGGGIGLVQSAVPAAASAFIPAAQRKASLSALALAAAQHQSDRNASDPSALTVSASDAASATDLSGDSAASTSASAVTTPLALSETERQIRRLRQTSTDGAAALVPSVAAAAPQAALPRHLLRRGSIQVCILSWITAIVKSILVIDLFFMLWYERP